MLTRHAGGKKVARLFFADFHKGFDLVDHDIIIRELVNQNVHPSVNSRAGVKRRARVLTPLGDLLHSGIVMEHSGILSQVQ